MQHPCLVDDLCESRNLYIAEQKGLFAAQGLDVTIVPVFTSSQQTVSDIESGKADISSGDYVTYMDDELQNNAHLEIVGEAGTPIPADPALISKGVFTAAPIPEPFVSEGEQQYGLEELADLDQGGTENFPIQGFAVTQTWAQQHPNTLKAFVTALDQGQQIADTDRSAVEQAIEQSPLKVAQGIAAVIALPDFPTAIDPTRLQRIVDDMIQFGFLSKKDASFNVSSISYAGNLATTSGADGMPAG